MKKKAWRPNKLRMNLNFRARNMAFGANLKYRQVSNIRRTLVGNWIVDHSEVVGASPFGAAPTTSSFSTWLHYVVQRQLQAKMRNIRVLGFGPSCIRDFTIIELNPALLQWRGVNWMQDIRFPPDEGENDNFIDNTVLTVTQAIIGNRSFFMPRTQGYLIDSQCCYWTWSGWAVNSYDFLSPFKSIFLSISHKDW